MRSSETDATASAPVPPPVADRRTMVEEILVVLSLSVLAGAAHAILSLIESPVSGVVVAAANQSNAFARQLLAFVDGPGRGPERDRGGGRRGDRRPGVSRDQAAAAVVVGAAGGRGERAAARDVSPVPGVGGLRGQPGDG